MGRSASSSVPVDDGVPQPTRSERQDEIVNMFPPSTAWVVHRANTNPDGSEIQTMSEYFEYPPLHCKSTFVQVTAFEQKRYKDYMLELCGIQVHLQKLNKAL